MAQERVTLWQNVEAGGCARKLPPEMLRRLAPWLQDSDDQFMEDAAIVTVGSQVVVQTIDFITPLVPDPGDFGRIAAANSMSDIFVVGARPVVALAVACVPLGDGVLEYQRALEAARAHLSLQGCELVGGHSVVDPEPKLGFAVTGITRSRSGLIGHAARPGDVLLLTKPIGVGVVCSAYKAGVASEEQLMSAVETMTRTNDCVTILAESDLADAVHAATDVTGFGLVAHVGELCRRSRVGATLELDALPLIDGAYDLAEADMRTSALGTNMAYVQDVLGLDLRLVSETYRILLTDPQTSGGAVLSIDPNAAEHVAKSLLEHGVHASRIGVVSAGSDLAVI